MNSSSYIKYEEWEDFWCLKPTEEITLETLVDFNTTSWKPINKNLKIIIESNRDGQKPTDKQVESLQFVKNNQIQIIESIYNFHQKIVFPLYYVSIDIEDDQIISNRDQTNIVYSIKSIRIPHLSSEESNYFVLNFHFNYDDEHDMSFLFKNLSVIDFVGLGDDFIDYKELYENKLNGGNSELTISIYDKPNSSSIYRDKHFIHENIDFEFKLKVYTIAINREKWPQSFKLFFFPKNPKKRYSISDIINLT